MPTGSGYVRFHPIPCGLNSKDLSVGGYHHGVLGYLVVSPSVRALKRLPTCTGWGCPRRLRCVTRFFLHERHSDTDLHSDWHR
jgi:hypothetical protein